MSLLANFFRRKYGTEPIYYWAIVAVLGFLAVVLLVSLLRG